jgi:serine palmitoyltransferase
MLWLQEKLAKFMGTEEAIIYSYDLATVPSILPAFANTKDLIVCDEVCPSLA